MKKRVYVRGRRLVAVGGALSVLAALLVMWTGSGPQQVSAAPHAGLNFTMSVPGYSGCTTAQGDATCYIPPGTNITVNMTLDPLPSDIPSYEGYDVTLHYTGLTSADNAVTSSWPDCGFPATSYSAGVVILGCSIGVDSTPSQYSGLLATNGFTCSQSGSITMAHGDGNTDLIQGVGVIYSEAGQGEILNFQCGSPPTATVPATATPLPQIGGVGSGGSMQTNDGQLGIWMLAVSLVIVACGVVAVSWRLSRGR